MRITALWCFTLSALMLAAWGESLVQADELAGLSAGDIFNRRILPIVKSDSRSSCTECHFAGVELKNFIHEDQATTFAALRADGLIDLEHPDQSKILRFIHRRPEHEDSLMAKVRRSEYAAFRAWIRAAVKNPELLAAKTDATVGTELPLEVVRHVRRDRVLASFVENIWSEIGRCINCHSPQRNQRLVRKHGESMSWIRPRDPEGTLAYLVEQGIIDVDDPDESLILQKPLVLVEHGGGPKFALGSRTDKNFRRFLNDYAAVIGRRYRQADQLPEPSQFVSTLTGQHLRIVDLPAALDKKLLRVNIHRRVGNRWSPAPWATADNPINGKRRMWQSMVLAIAPRESDRAERLHGAAPIPAGRYLVKIYVDRHDQVKQNRDYELGEEDFFGQVEIHGAWRPGYQPPKIIHSPRANRH